MSSLPAEVPVVNVVNLRIVGYNLKTEGAKSYVAYNIEVTTSSTSWQVERRYRDISSLSDWASKNFPTVTLPPLPSKLGALFKAPENVARERQSSLEQYLQSIFKVPELFTTWEVQNFLGIDSHVAALAPVQIPTLEGTLYVKVIEARNLPNVEPGKPVNPFAELYIVAAVNRPQRVGTLKTETYPESSTPKWYEEMLFSVLNRRVPLRLQIWDYRFLFSDRPLGHIELDLRPLQDLRLYDVWLPLLGAAPGEIHVLCQFTPMKINKPINTKLKPFRIHLEKTDYRPGEVVRGMLICNVGKPLAARQIFVRLLGMTETHWTENRTEYYTDSQGRSQTRTVTDHYGQRWKLIDEARIMWDMRNNSPTGRSEMLSGSYVWPFEFQLPPRLPPSFRCSTGWITYEVKAEIDKPGVFSFNTRIEVPLRMLAPYASNNPVPATYGRLQKVPFRSDDQIIYVQGQLNGNVSYLGEQQTLTLFIENMSRKDVLDAEISLVGSIVCKAHGRTHSSSINPLHMRLKNGHGFPVRAGTSQTVQVTFQLNDLAPTLPADLSPLIDLNYLLHVSCDISGFLSGYAKADIPVIISHPLPHVVAPQPVMNYPSVQPDLTMMVDYGIGLPQFSQEYYSPIPQQQFVPTYMNMETTANLPPPMFSAPPPDHSTFYMNQGGQSPGVGVRASVNMGSMGGVGFQAPAAAAAAAPMPGGGAVVVSAPGMDMNVNMNMGGMGGATVVASSSTMHADGMGGMGGATVVTTGMPGMDMNVNMNMGGMNGATVVASSSNMSGMGAAVVAPAPGMDVHFGMQAPSDFTVNVTPQGNDAHMSMDFGGGMTGGATVVTSSSSSSMSYSGPDGHFHASSTSTDPTDQINITLRD